MKHVCSAGLFFLGIVGCLTAAEESLVQFSAMPGAFPLAHRGNAAPLFISENDWPGVARAVGDLRADIARVTNLSPTLSTRVPAAGPDAVLIGTIGKSPLIDGLIARGLLDVGAIRGRWEAFSLHVVENPLPGIARALVVVGSDKRGTIYGVYELSAQIGVSPWRWWADVPVARHDEVYVRSAPWTETGPTVKYRGIFLNDEAPALTGWAREKFGGLNRGFYEHVFELLLRLRANFLWPAMWNNAFNEDDAADPKVADEFGIVMGTSHHEPMMRSQQEWKRHGSGPWNYATNGEVLRHFWEEGMRRNRDFENIVTIGMRGDGDEAMSEETNVSLLEQIVADQRKIIRAATGRDPSGVPQLWALYKEVQTYYEHGMRVPDDVTLLWCDDNWGNIRRLPTSEERGRSGGAGVYYHFDYVGGPRNYKWLNTIPISKVWEQMNLAWKYDANRIWIVNVGDLKPMEFPIEFFLRYAWRPAAIPYEDLGTFSRSWAERQFGREHAEEIAKLIDGYTKLNGRRKPELLAPDTFSLVNYEEAEGVLEAWRDLARRAENVDAKLPADARPAFFQLVLYPVEACRAVNEMYIAAGLNRLYAVQGRASTHLLAARVREWFETDAALTRRWDEMLDGKWRHMMDQTHLGYTTWQQPVRNAMPAITEIQVPRAGSVAVAVEGDPAARPADYPISAIAKIPPLSPNGPSARWFDIFNRGQEPVRFTVETSDPWLKTSVNSGVADSDIRVKVSVDWANLPPGRTEAKAIVRSGAGDPPLEIAVPIDCRTESPNGFIETEGHIAIEAPHFSRAVNGKSMIWHVLPDFGPVVGAVTAEDSSSDPLTRASTGPGTDGRIQLDTTACLEYDVMLYSSGDMSVEVECAPSLDFQGGDGLSFALSFDDAPPQRVKLGTAETGEAWERSVAEGVRRVRTRQRVSSPGRHVLKFWALTPGIVLERIIVNAGAVRPSYLGPPESPYFPKK